MFTNKAKRKRSPRRRRLVLAGVIVGLLLVIGFIVIPYAEVRLNKWLENDPFTPMCDADHLEVAFDSNVEGGVHIYRVRANGEKPRQVSILNPGYPSFQWTPDGQYLIFYLPDTNPGELHFMVADTGELATVSLPNYYHFGWFIMPDSSAVIVKYRDSDNPVDYDAIFRVALPLVESTVAEEIDAIPDALVNYNYFGESLGGRLHLAWYLRRESFEIEQAAYSIDGSYIAVAYGTKQRAGVNLQRSIFVQDATTREAVWEIGDERTDYDVQYVIHDMSSSNELLYFRQYYPVGQNSVDLDMPIEVFIADIEERRIDPIFEFRPYKYIRSLNWSLNGEAMFIALYDHQTLTAEIYLGGHDGSNWTHVTSLPSSHYSNQRYAWTPDGQYLSYLDMNNWIYLIDLESRKICRVAKGRTDRSTIYVWRLVPEDER